MCPLRDCSITDRILLNLRSPLLDNHNILYILTLGVVERLRLRGIGSQLLAQVLERARSLQCLAVSLHVIDYNAAAIAFYQRHGFKELALLHDFYYIGYATDKCSFGYSIISALINRSMFGFTSLRCRSIGLFLDCNIVVAGLCPPMKHLLVSVSRTGRQPTPEKTRYNAYLYSLPLHEEAASTCTALLSIDTLMSPLRYYLRLSAQTLSSLGQLLDIASHA